MAPTRRTRIWDCELTAASASCPACGSTSRQAGRQLRSGPRALGYGWDQGSTPASAVPGTGVYWTEQASWPKGQAAPPTTSAQTEDEAHHQAVIEQQRPAKNHPIRDTWADRAFSAGLPC